MVQRSAAWPRVVASSCRMIGEAVENGVCEKRWRPLAAEPGGADDWACRRCGPLKLATSPPKPTQADRTSLWPLKSSRRISSVALETFFLFSRFSASLFQVLFGACSTC